MKNKLKMKRLMDNKYYLDALFKKYGDLCIMRVELYYVVSYEKKKGLKQINKDFRRMINNMKSIPSLYDGRVGYLCKRDYDEDRGVYIEMLYFYRDTSSIDPVEKSDALGKYWNRTVAGNGGFFNCNKDKYKRLGIGKVSKSDMISIGIMKDNVFPHFCRVSSELEDVRDVNDRTYSRGLLK